MTEEEAKKKWCPMVRVMSDEGSMVIATVNRGSGLQAETNCIASDCALWVWDVKEKWFNGLPAGKETSTTSGHCGLIK